MDSSLDEIQAARVRAHLATCDRCRAVFFDSARVQAAWDADSSPFEPTLEQVDAAMAVAGRHKKAPQLEASKKSLRRFRLGPLFRKLAVAAAVVIMAAAGWFGVVNRESRDLLDEQLLAPVRAAVETASSNGMIVYPGGENNLSQAPSAYRSGISPSGRALEESLETLYDLYQTNRDAAFWMITGYLATGRIKTALDFAREAQGLYRDDPDIITLSAVAAYVNGDYAGAETLFRKAAVLDSENPVILVDLSLVLIDQNNADEARVILESVINNRAGTPISKRAQRITEGLLPH